MFCSNCGAKRDESSKFCPNCGKKNSQLVGEESKGDAVTATKNQDNVQKALCINCKGLGLKRKKGSIIISLLLEVFVAFPLLFVFGGMAGSTGIIGFLLLSSSILGWGFKKRKCQVCGGTGSKVL
ncbi:MAG: zinc-ribbon domain-containing protein [Tissierellaceae bacterium]|nr:zinc-ribbon domain-containing protein [Tissierellaceae bacterium]